MAMGFWKVFPMVIVGAKTNLFFLKSRVLCFLQDPVAPAVGENPIGDLGVPVSESHGTLSTVLNKETEQCAPGSARQLPTAGTT